MKIRKFFYNAKTSADYFANLFTYMKVQGRNQYKNTNETFQRVKTKLKSYYPCIKNLKKNPC